MSSYGRVLRMTIFGLAVAISVPMFAELGGQMDTIAADAAHMKATRRVTATAKYAVHEMKADSGTVVREYVSPQGKVFAVSWEGPYKPDLRQLMGAANFEAYTTAAARVKAHGGPRRYEVNGLVVEVSGHQRDFHGRAYLQQDVPAGTDVAEIQ